MSTTPTSTTPPVKEPMLTGYSVHKLVKKALADANLPTIPAQMVYSYIQNKLIKSELVGDQRRVRKSVADAWVAKYVANKKRRMEEAAQA